MHSVNRLIVRGCAAAVVAVAMSACTPKNISYFQDVDNTVISEMTQRKSIRVEPEDKLSIVVNSKDPALAALFNLPVMTNRLGNTQSASGTGATLRNYSGESQGMSSYTVSADGDIDFPILGKLHIEGMTRGEVAGFIKGELIGRDLVKDPVVTVEFLNTGVSVLGEVNRPGRYDMNRDNLTLLEALGLAGDLTLQGQRENVLVMREVDGKMQTYRINLLNAHEMVQSPGYYLQQDDVVYVEPNDFRKRQTTNNANTALNASFWVSVASLLTSVAVLIFK